MSGLLSITSDQHLNSDEVVRRLKEVFPKLAMPKPDEKKFAEIKRFIDAEGQGYLEEAEFDSSIRRGY